MGRAMPYSYPSPHILFPVLERRVKGHGVAGSSVFCRTSKARSTRKSMKGTRGSENGK